MIVLNPDEISHSSRIEPKMDEINRIRKQIENRHKIKLPEIAFHYSDNITSAFCSHSVAPPELRDPSKLTDYQLLNEKMANLHQKWRLKLKLEGLSDSEIENVDLWKFTIFIPKQHPNYPVGLYFFIWHELGHAAAFMLHVKDMTINESIAIAHGIRGLLLELQEGRVEREKAFHIIEEYIQDLIAHPFSFFSLHKQALKAIRLFNPSLKFSERDINELITELDKSIDIALEVDRRIKLRFEKPFIKIMILVAVALFIISIILSLLK